MSPRLVLVGAPGAGKSTVGALVAQRLDVEFADSDALIESAVGSSVSDIFVEHGEDHFRQLEATAVADALATFDGVLGLGGGAILDASTRALLADQPVVLLTVGLSAAASRVGLNRDRPLLLGNVRAQMAKLMHERAALYESVATWIVDTDDRTAEQVADQVIDQMAKSHDAEGAP